MIVLFVILTILFLLKRNNLLLSLLVLEIISFISIFYFSYIYSSYIFRDYMLIVLFSVFVIEGVIGLSGLIRIVRYSGSDYVRARRLSKC